MYSAPPTKFVNYMEKITEPMQSENIQNNIIKIPSFFKKTEEH
jgi:hypothetical protein